LELISAFIGGFFGVIGAFLGVWFANYYERKAQKLQQQQDTTIALYTEFNSDDMIKSRIKANKLLGENRDRSNPFTLTEMSRTLDPEDWYHISKVFTFFEKFGIYLETDNLDKDLTKQLLGRRFLYWYEKQIRDLMTAKDKPQLERNRPIQYIYGWLRPYRDQLMDVVDIVEE
jgi:hypothetical protein